MNLDNLASATAMFPDELTVTMSFPVAVKLELAEWLGIVGFPAGEQLVPVSLADHWWLAANGAVLVEKDTNWTVTA